VLAGIELSEPVASFEDLHGGPARVLFARVGKLDLAVLEAAHLYQRPGNPYTDAAGRDWPDNAHRFAALGRAAAALGQGAVPGYAPDVVHAHDWQAGLAPAYLHYSGGRRPGTVMTIHNLAFQGSFPAGIFNTLGLPHEAFSIDGVEFYGGVGFLKAGLQLADRITTVSPTYSAEIRRPGAGMGLHGLLQYRSDAISGILNGIDEAVWDPAADPHLARRFTAKSLNRRLANKRKLQERFGLTPSTTAMVVGVVSRLSWQKGLDLLLDALPGLLQLDLQLVVLGTGDAAIEAALGKGVSSRPGPHRRVPRL
jgi:starch synthase